VNVLPGSYTPILLVATLNGIKIWEEKASLLGWASLL
jgi:hypothetical protein